MGLSPPDRDQTLELAITGGLMVSATGWLLLLHLKRRHIRADMNTPRRLSGN